MARTTNASAKFNRRKADRQVERNLRNLYGQNVNDIDLDEYDDFEEHERFVSVQKHFSHSDDDF